MKGRIVFLKKLRKKGVIEKMNPKNDNEYIISYYDDKKGNKLSYVSLPKSEFDANTDKKLPPSITSIKLDEDYFFIHPETNYSFVLLKSLHVLAKIIKMNPTYTDEFVVEYCIDNKYHYKSVTKQDLLPIKNYDKIKDRTNIINRLLDD